MLVPLCSATRCEHGRNPSWGREVVDALRAARSRWTRRAGLRRQRRCWRQASVGLQAQHPDGLERRGSATAEETALAVMRWQAGGAVPMRRVAVGSGGGVA